MRAKTCLSLFAIASIVIGTIAAALPVKASPGDVKINAKYRSAQDPYIPGVAVNGWVYCIVDIESPYDWDLTGDGIVGWTFDVHVDPDVLIVWAAMGAGMDYFLYDHVDWNQDPYGPYDGTNYPSILVGSVDKTNGDFIDISEWIFGYENTTIGAGGSSYPEDYWYGAGYGLCRLRFRSKSATAYSKIDISDAYWYRYNGSKPGPLKADKIPIPDSDITDGHYNAPPVPEFPLGAAVEVGLIVAVAYIWWTRRRRLKLLGSA